MIVGERETFAPNYLDPSLTDGFSSERVIFI